MTNEEAIESFKHSNEQAKVRLEVEKMRMDSGEIKELEFYIERDEMAIKALEQEPCEYVVDHEKVNDILGHCIHNQEDYYLAIKMLNELPPVKSQEPKTEQFAKWVASEIFDDMWKYNKDAFAELACRKLAKLGIVKANGDEWELVEPQESDKCSKCKYHINPDYTRCKECGAERSDKE